MTRRRVSGLGGVQAEGGVHAAWKLGRGRGIQLIFVFAQRRDTKSVKHYPHRRQGMMGEEESNLPLHWKLSMLQSR